MAVDVERALAARGSNDRVVRMVDAVVRWVPGGAVLPTWTSLADGATSLGLDGSVVELAQARLAQDSFQRALWMLEAQDEGEDVISIASGLGTALRLYFRAGPDGTRGGIAALDEQQRKDAAEKVLALGFVTWKLFPGDAVERVSRLRELPTGRALLAWMGTIEVLVPFSEEAHTPGALRMILDSEREAAFERLSRVVGHDEANAAAEAWPVLADAAVELASAGATVVDGVTGVLGKFLPKVLTAVDFTGAVVAGSFDALPVYHLLGARLVAEAALHGDAPDRIIAPPPVAATPASTSTVHDVVGDPNVLPPIAPEDDPRVAMLEDAPPPDPASFANPELTPERTFMLGPEDPEPQAPPETVTGARRVVAARLKPLVPDPVDAAPPSPAPAPLLTPPPLVRPSAPPVALSRTAPTQPPPSLTESVSTPAPRPAAPPVPANTVTVSPSATLDAPASAPTSVGMVAAGAALAAGAAAGMAAVVSSARAEATPVAAPPTLPPTARPTPQVPPPSAPPAAMGPVAPDVPTPPAGAAVLPVLHAIADAKEREEFARPKWTPASTQPDAPSPVAPAGTSAPVVSPAPGVSPAPVVSPAPAASPPPRPTPPLPSPSSPRTLTGLAPPDPSASVATPIRPPAAPPAPPAARTAPDSAPPAPARPTAFSRPPAAPPIPPRTLSVTPSAPGDTQGARETAPVAAPPPTPPAARPTPSAPAAAPPKAQAAAPKPQAAAPKPQAVAPQPVAPRPQAAAAPPKKKGGALGWIVVMSLLALLACAGAGTVGLAVAASQGWINTNGLNLPWQTAKPEPAPAPAPAQPPPRRGGRR